tara:strand:+ start:30 stop:371 length:342 start_codon:yes stop_codon:yes gene_type:complete
MIINLESVIDNASVQVGDTAYYVNTGDLSSLNNQQIGNGNPQVIGVIQEIGPSFIRVSGSSTVPSGSFLMFSKDNRVNNGRLKGYYAEVIMRHAGGNPAELFAVSSEVAISSK